MFTLDFIRSERRKYQLNLDIITAIIHSTLFHSNNDFSKVLFSFSRSFRTISESGDINDVTPDLYLHPLTTTPVIIELKLNYKYGEKDSADYYQAILKYDRICDGWACDETQDIHEVGLMIGIRHKDKLKDLLKMINGEYERLNNVFILSGGRIEDKGEYYIHIELEHGNIDNKLLKGIYNKTDSVKESNFTSYDYYFYDQPPTLAHITNVLWQKVFARVKGVVEPLGEGRKYALWEVKIEDMLNLLKDMHKGNIPEKFAGREQTIPRKEWLLEAMRYLVYLKHATEKDYNTYHIKWKKIANDTMKYFEEKYISEKYYKNDGLFQGRLEIK